MTKDNPFKAGDIVMLDNRVNFVLCVRGTWCWVVPNNDLNTPETVEHILLEPAHALAGI